MESAPVVSEARREVTASGVAARGAVVVRWRILVPAGLLGVVATAALTGVPTDLVPTSWFTRMTPIQGYAYPVWVATALLGGALLALHVGVARVACQVNRAERPAGALGVIGTFLSVGCPVCNKLVVAALGVTGATSYFAPAQPVLAIGSLMLLLAAVAIRMRALFTR